MKAQKKVATKALGGIPPKKSGDIPVTKRMLDETRSELKSDITSVRLEMRAGFRKMNSSFKKVDLRFKDIDSRFEQVDLRFKDIDSRFEQVDLRFKDIDSRFDQVDSKIEILRIETNQRFDKLETKIDSALTEMNGKFHQMLVLIEEQNARNIFVLDGYMSLDHRMTALEKKSSEI